MIDLWNGLSLSDIKNGIDITESIIKYSAGLINSMPTSNKKYLSDEFLNYDAGFLNNMYCNEKNGKIDFIPYVNILSINTENVGSIKINITVDEDEIFKLNRGDEDWEKVVCQGYARLLDSGRIKQNEDLIRVSNYKIHNNEICLKIQKSSYHDQAKSNLILDYHAKNQRYTLLTWQ